MDKVDKNLDPDTPMKRPNKLVEKKPKKGNNNMSRYILKKLKV